jgi:hypothetical protein
MVGEKLNEALAKAGDPKFRPYEPVRLVGFKVFGVTAGKITVSATRRQQGICIVGPAYPKRDNDSDERMLQRCRGHRWVFHRVVAQVEKDKHGKEIDIKTIHGPCAIRPAYRIQLLCPVCGFQPRPVWSDKLKKDLNHICKEKGLPLDKAHEQAIVCRRCQRNGTEVAMTVTALKNTLFPAGKPNEDPVYRESSTPELDEFKALWAQPAEASASVFPRIWAVYPLGKAPCDWEPEDELAAEISRRVRGEDSDNEARKKNPGEIRPLAVALKEAADNGEEKTTEARSLIMEALPNLQVGWVKQDHLYQFAEHSYSCQLLRPRRRDQEDVV